MTTVTKLNWQSLLDRAFDIIPEIFPDQSCGATAWRPAGTEEREEDVAMIYLWTATDEKCAQCQIQVLTSVLADRRVPILAQGSRGNLYIAIVDSYQTEELNNLIRACRIVEDFVQVATCPDPELAASFLRSTLTMHARLQQQRKRK